ncbi:MAG TPA: hypothetical protein VMN03_08750, partial [Burkholderiales bacterium]|nr:hypothetical protein [Burkholderiales bacterium]
GTPGYMSPEQAAGFTDTDAKTDVYSLAVLVYEMITGAIPGRWVLEDSTRAGRFLDAPATHRPALSAAGATVEGALVRALALRPDQRTASPAAFMDDLRGRAKAGRRQYRPQEIEAIVGRAAELEASNPTVSGAMTMGGIEQVAREVGIDPAVVRSAARELATRPPFGSTPVLPTAKNNVIIGGPTRIGFERIVAGELDETDFALLVEEIRRFMGEVGQVSQLGRSFTWTLIKGNSGTRNVEVAVTVRGGRTRILVQENLNNLMGAIFGGLGGGLGGGGGVPVAAAVMGATHNPALLLFALPAWLLTVFAIARTSYHFSAKGRARKLEELANRLAHAAQSLIEEQPKLPAPPRVSRA